MRHLWPDHFQALLSLARRAFRCNYLNNPQELAHLHDQPLCRFFQIQFAHKQILWHETLPRLRLGVLVSHRLSAHLVVNRLALKFRGIEKASQSVLTWGQACWPEQGTSIDEKQSCTVNPSSTVTSMTQDSTWTICPQLKELKLTQQSNCWISWLPVSSIIGSCRRLKIWPDTWSNS